MQEIKFDIQPDQNHWLFAMNPDDMKKHSTQLSRYRLGSQYNFYINESEEGVSKSEQ